MYTAVLEICKVHETTWSSIPGFASAVNEFEATLQTLKLDATKQESVRDGVTLMKFAKLGELFDRLMLIHTGLAIHAKSIHDEEMFIRNTVSPTDLKRLSITRLDFHLNKVLIDLEEHGASLVIFGIDSGMVQDTISLIEEGRLQSTRPRMSIIEKRQLTQKLDEGVSKLDEILKLKLDALMRLFKFNHPDFFQLYFAARVVIEYPGKKGSSTSENGSPPENEDPF
jgi:hypothetical protein